MKKRRCLPRSPHGELAASRFLGELDKPVLQRNLR